MVMKHCNSKILEHVHVICFGCFSMRKIIERYRKQSKDHEQANMTEANQQYMQVRNSISWNMIFHLFDFYSSVDACMLLKY